MIKLIKSDNKLDIVTNCIDKYPKGLACEVSRSKLFFDNLKNIRNKNHKEHIFNYFYKNKKKFKILKYNDHLYQKNLNLNLSIDTERDRKKIEKILVFFKKNYHVKTSDVLKNIKKIRFE